MTHDVPVDSVAYSCWSLKSPEGAVDDCIELIPENPDFETIVVPTTGADAGEVQFELEGLAVGLIRNNMML